MATYKIVLWNDTKSSVEMKVAAETGNNHLIYLYDVPAGGMSLIPNGDGQGRTDWINSDVNNLAQNWKVLGW